MLYAFQKFNLHSRDQIKVQNVSEPEHQVQFQFMAIESCIIDLPRQCIDDGFDFQLLHFRGIQFTYCDIIDGKIVAFCTISTIYQAKCIHWILFCFFKGIWFSWYLRAELAQATTCIVFNYLVVKRFLKYSSNSMRQTSHSMAKTVLFYFKWNSVWLYSTRMEIKRCYFQF